MNTRDNDVPQRHNTVYIDDRNAPSQRFRGDHRQHICLPAQRYENTDHIQLQNAWSNAPHSISNGLVHDEYRELEQATNQPYWQDEHDEHDMYFNNSNEWQPRDANPPFAFRSGEHPNHRHERRYQDDEPYAYRPHPVPYEHRDPYHDTRHNRLFRLERGHDRDRDDIQHRYRAGQSIDSNSDSSTESQVRNDKPKKIRSGINVKPTSSIQEQLRYPHFSLGQISGFINMNLQFHNLSYEQFIAGELVTINNSMDLDEQQGHTELLQRISQWQLRSNVTWPQVRNTYAHIIRCIENKEITWQTNWDQFERFIYDKVNTQNTTAKNDKAKAVVKPKTESVWFCCTYQRSEGCSKDAPHPGRIGTQICSLLHICATCWLKEKIK